MKITPNSNELDLTKLDTFVSKHSNGIFFQSSKAFKFFQSVENYEPIIIIAEDNEIIVGSLLAVIIKEGKSLKGYFSSRCIVYGGPIAKDDDKNVIYALLKKLNERIARYSIYIEFRNLFELSGYKNIFFKNGFKYKEHLNYIVNIETTDKNLKKLNTTRRRQIKKSLKAGAEIIEAKNITEIKEFYLLLKNLYKEKIKKPLPPFIFFERFFYGNNYGKYFLIKYNTKIIGGIMCPIYKETIYEWYVCGLDKNYKNIYPSVLSTWAAIEYAANNGLKYFDFLGAGSPDSDYGVREFKSKFGGELVNYGRFIKINKPLFYSLGKFVLKLKKNLSK